MYESENVVEITNYMSDIIMLSEWSKLPIELFIDYFERIDKNNIFMEWHTYLYEHHHFLHSLPFERYSDDWKESSKIILDALYTLKAGGEKWLVNVNTEDIIRDKDKEKQKECDEKLDKCNEKYGEYISYIEDTINVVFYCE